jgi:hypothetical protein
MHSICDNKNKSEDSIFLGLLYFIYFMIPGSKGKPKYYSDTLRMASEISEILCR